MTELAMQKWADCPDAEDHGHPYHCGRPIEGHPAWDCPRCEGAGTVAVHPEPQKVDTPGAFIEVQPAMGAVSIYAYGDGDGAIISAADAFETAMALARAAISAGHRPPPSFRLPRTPDEEANINEAARLEALILSGDATAEDEATYRDVKARMSPSDDVIQALRALRSGVER